MKSHPLQDSETIHKGIQTLTHLRLMDDWTISVADFMIGDH
jgi:hypothetical protein